MNGKRLFFIVILLSLAAAVVAILPADQAKLALPSDPAVLIGKLPNGLTYYIMSNPQPKNIAEMRLFVNIGCVNEDEDQRGLAHFTEHMAFNGTASFAKTEIVDYLSSIGMGFMNGLNGMTSYDFTIYTFKLPTDDSEKLRKGVHILSEMASKVSFNEDDLNNERGIILEEYRLGQGAQQRISDAQNAVRFAGSKYADHSPIGTKEVLENFTPETIRRFYKDWYRPDNQSVVVVGDFDPQAMLALITEFFAPIPKAKNPRPVETFTVPEYTQSRAVVTKDKEFPYNMLTVNWQRPVVSFKTYNDLYESLKQQLFSSMLNARLSEISRRPNPPFSMGMNYSGNIIRTMRANILLAIMGPNKWNAALETLLTEAERVQQHGFTASEYERAKTSVLRSMEQSVAASGTQASDDITWEFFDTLTSGDVKVSAQDQLRLATSMIDAISLDEVNVMVSSLIEDKNMFISLVGPDLPNISYPNPEDLLAVSRTIASAKIDPWQDLTVTKPLMAKAPTGGSIVKEVVYRRNGYKKWVLSNGAVVYAKKTNFKQDEVLLTATSPGGYSLVDEDLIPAARQLGEYISESGFGDFDAASLEKATTGKVASVSLGVWQLSESIDASCSPQDMEVMFQMLHQYTTNPRFTEEAMEPFLDKARLQYENKDLDPQSSFFETVDSETFAYHPYSREMRIEDFDNVTLDRLETVYRDRFADMSDFTYFIVGNFDEARLKEMVSTYLATLPKVRRKDVYQDRGIRPVSGIKDVTIYKGADQRCFSALVTHNPANLSSSERLTVNTLAYILNEKLRENIRESRSGVYVVQSWPSTDRYPSPFTTTTVFMACSPERVQELNIAIIATIDSLKAGDFADKYINDAKLTILNVFNENIRTNSFWSIRMSSALQLGRPIDAFVNTPALLEKIDRAAIVDVAKRYLNFDKNMLSVIMLPEGSPAP